MKKIIILSKDNKELMSFDEVLEAFTGLIFKNCQKWTTQYEYDDLYQMASIALWRAYEKYDAGKKPVGFAHFANKYISTALLKNEQLNFPKTKNKTSKIKEVVSNQRPVGTSRRGEPVLIEDFIGDMDYRLEYTAERILLTKCISEMSSNDKILILEFLSNQNPKKISKTHGISYEGYRYRMKTMFSRLKSKMEVTRI